MEQTTKRRQEQRTQQMMTGNNQSNSINLMTDYLENNSVVPTVNKAAELTPEELPAVKTALNSYRVMVTDMMKAINRSTEEVDGNYLKLAQNMI